MQDDYRQTEGGQFVEVAAGSVVLEGNLVIPDGAKGIVLFAHGSGSSRFSPRNQYVADMLRGGGLATLLIDLLTAEEERMDQTAAKLRFDMGVLARRLIGAVDWLCEQDATTNLAIGMFGSSTGAAAALLAAAERPDAVRAVVSHGGRPDLAASHLADVKAPTLLIVGGQDEPVIELNEQAYARISAEKHMEIIPGATHLFEEPSTLEQVAGMARDWFEQHLTP